MFDKHRKSLGKKTEAVSKDKENQKGEDDEPLSYINSLYAKYFN
jgi:hypothetical protein